MPPASWGRSIHFVREQKVGENGPRDELQPVAAAFLEFFDDVGPDLGSRLTYFAACFSLHFVTNE